jgi:hypothetical protein
MRAVKLVLFLGASLFSPDAAAWGLQTHVFIAQWALVAVPLGDAQLRSAVLRFPWLVLAGGCLPDLALAGRMLGEGVFRTAHQWRTLRRLATTCWDEERALALGYASHLLADVIAHNQFVPEHERRVAQIPHVTHALCEWAMDAHVARRIHAEPTALIAENVTTLSQAAARTFGCGERLARRAMLGLARADRALRLSATPVVCAAALRVLHGERSAYFDGYLRQACAWVRRAESVLLGVEPLLDPEPPQAMAKDAPAIAAPSSNPATTSLG